MFIQATQLIGRPVAFLHSDEHVGRIHEIIFESQTGRVAGLVVSRFLKKEKFLSPMDILDITPSALYVQDEDSLLDPDELVRARDARAQQIPILGQSAQTRTGKRLGQVENVLITSDEWMIAKFYIRRFFDTRILPNSAVWKITKKAVVFEERVDQPDQEESVQPEIATA